MQIELPVGIYLDFEFTYGKFTYGIFLLKGEVGMLSAL